MMTTAIRIDNISKYFDLVKGSQRSLKAALLSFRRAKPERVAALSDIDLTINTGEAVAIIGKNGSGKSTLLRLIGRVYKPTTGSITAHGRMSTMLDWGAGFHPDLTGRENIYFNGAILGLSNAQVKERVDRIIEFSELADFIDAPVRTYSKGMLMRLGFSIAIETDPDILLIDEVLVVGDAAFEEKCYDRIDEYKRSGRTIVFVTHDLEAARSVATRTLWIDGGLLRADGDPGEVVSEYLATVPRQDHHASRDIR